MSDDTFIGLFCRIKSLLQGSFAKETYIFKKPTNHRHPIVSYDTFSNHFQIDVSISSGVGSVKRFKVKGDILKSHLSGDFLR